MDRPDLLGMLPEDLAAFVDGLGEPRYRARQLLSWLHRGEELAEMTTMPGTLRETIARVASAGTLAPIALETAPDGAAKYGFRTSDGHLIETVLIPHARRITVCVSSQIGCAFGCMFCATGRQGLTRSLRPGEIVEQVVRVQRDINPRRVSRVVFMGMGEPLANLDAVLAAVRLLNCEDGLHIGARRIAISTCGLPDQIRRLAGEGLQVGLSISLHGATDDVRADLAPITRKHPVDEVIAAARHFAHATGRKVAFEWVVVPGRNDTPEQAARLATLVKDMACMVNVIPLNPTGEPAPADPSAAYRFASLLRRRGLPAVVRRSRGAAVLGACGQLRSRMEGRGNAGRVGPRPAQRISPYGRRLKAAPPRRPHPNSE